MEQTVIYGDVLFLLDFSMDYLALYFTGSVLGIRTGLRSLCAAAAFGAGVGLLLLIYAGGAVGSFLIAAASAVVSCLIMIPRAVLGGRLLLSASVVFFLSEAALGGFMTLFYRGMSRLVRSTGLSVPGGTARLQIFAAAALLSAISISAGFRFFRQRKQGGDTGSITVRFGNAVSVYPCFIDTGNMAREPISGLPVVFLPEREAAVLGISAAKLKDGLLPGSRLIPLSTVSGGGLYWGLRPDLMTLDTPQKRPLDAYIIFSDCLKTEENGIARAVVPAVS